MNQLLKIHTKV